MEKPFTIQVNDLHLEIIKKLNEAKMPCYVLRTILNDILKEIEDADGKELNEYFNEIQKEKNIEQEEK